MKQKKRKSQCPLPTVTPSGELKYQRNVPEARRYSTFGEAERRLETYQYMLTEWQRSSAEERAKRIKDILKEIEYIQRLLKRKPVTDVSEKGQKGQNKKEADSSSASV